LADEINRTSPRTQAALLEVMEEGSVTVDGTTYPLYDPFIVIATQNPVGSVGTQRLPDSQLDRFMVCLSMGYPDHASAIEILKGNAGERITKLQSIITKELLTDMQKGVKEVFVHDSVYDYIINLTEATRDPSLFNLGLSPRGSIALLNMAKASAFIHQQNFLSPEDISDVFFDVVSHRVIVNPSAKIDKKNALCRILETTPLPRVQL
ncbi:MAG: MoxR family ATPase, partial [Clostridium sp.]|nr:MoxR family ATPase [Clostridium sp.]